MTPDEEFIDYVKGLRGSCRPGILSNSFAGARETALYQFGELVEQMVYSHGTGIEKPGPRACEAACVSLDVRPASCLCIDDAAVNVAAAQAAGPQTQLFEDNTGTAARIAAHPDAGPLTPERVPSG